MTEETKKLLDTAIQEVKDAKTPEERHKASERLSGIKATIMAYTFNKAEMDRLT